MKNSFSFIFQWSSSNNKEIGIKNSEKWKDLFNERHRLGNYSSEKYSYLVLKFLEYFIWCFEKK